MEHMDVPRFLGLLAIILGTAQLFSFIARKVGQPAVLGELLAGMLLGTSLLGLVDARNEILHLLAEVGVVILLFEIGLETDLQKLLQVGVTSMAVAIVGVALPFALGYIVCWLLDLSTIVSVVVGASLTATSVGITARVFSELGRLHEPESRIVLGAAVIDDIIGLIILTVVTGLIQGKAVTISEVVKITGIAFGFLAAVLLLGSLLIVPLAHWTSKRRITDANTVTIAVVLALGLAWLAAIVGSATIIGAFAVGILMGKTPQAEGIHRGVIHLGHFFVPIFFVMVGAAVQIQILNPLDQNNQQTLFMGGLLIVAAVVGKFVAGYAPFWFHGNKNVVGVGMIPRGEVGLIFNDLGLRSGVFNAALFSAVTLMVMVTTFIVPPLLKLLLKRAIPEEEQQESHGLEELVL